MQGGPHQADVQGFPHVDVVIHLGLHEREEGVRTLVDKRLDHWLLRAAEVEGARGLIDGFVGRLNATATPPSM